MEGSGSSLVTRDFWADRRVFVTGHTGFKGSWLSAWLNLSGARVTGYALSPETSPSLFEDAQLAECVTSILGDVRNQSALSDAMESAEPEIVFHLAAQPLVRRSYVDPLDTLTTNVIGTANLLEAVRRRPSVRVVVIVTTDKCYENREWFWGYRETDALGGRDPYSASKACAELVTGCYRDSFFADSRVAVASVRAGNVIGGGDWSEDRIIPDIVRSVLSETPALVRNPRAIRPWQHVLDPLGGYLKLAAHLFEDRELSGAFNFGPGDSEQKTVLDLARSLLRGLGRGELQIAELGPKVHEAHWLRLDSSKARALLDWRPQLGTERAIAWTAHWYAAYLTDRSRARALLEQQITEYIGLGRIREPPSNPPG